MNPKDIEKILQADFSDDPHRVQAFQIPMEDDRGRLPLPEQSPMPDLRPALDQVAPAQAPQSDLSDRRAKFEELMSRLGEMRGKDALNKMQVSDANPAAQAQLGSMGNMDEAIAQRNEAQKKAQMIRAFNKMIQGGTSLAGGKITDGSELAKALEKNAGQPISDIQTKEKMQQTRDQEGRTKEKHEVVMDKLRQDLEQNQLNFQDAQAIRDPNSPQSQMVQEYFLEMNAAMGRQVNPETVRQQPAEMLYKISPWMQNIYATKLKNDMQRQRLGMDRERLDNEKERLSQGRERLDLLTGKEGRLKDQFDKKFEDTQQEQSAKIVDKFEKDKVVQKSNESIAQADNVIQLVRSDNPIGHSAIPTFMARASGEVGNLSEADKAPFGGSQALSARIKQVMEKYQSGELTPENQAFVVDLAETMKKSSRRNKASRAMDLRGKYSKSYKMDMKDVNDLMMPELNNLDPEDQEAVEWALGNPTDPKADTILKLHGF